MLRAGATLRGGFIVRAKVRGVGSLLAALSTRGLASVVVAGLCHCSGEVLPSSIPPRATASAAPSVTLPAKPTSTARASATPAGIDLQAATTPTLLWSYPTEGGEPLLLGDGVVVIDAGASSASLVRSDGARTWQVKAPSGVSFSSTLKALAGRAVLLHGYGAKGESLSRVDSATGKLIWHRDGLGEPTLGDDGTGATAASSQKCSSAVLDLDTGVLGPHPLADSLFEVFEQESPPHPRCRRSTRPILERGGVTLLSRHEKGAEILEAFNRAGQSRYKLPLDQAHARLVHADEKTAVLLLLGREVTYLRLKVESGETLARQEIATAAQCDEDRTGPYAEVVPATSGQPAALFTRLCGQASLRELTTAKLIWSAPIGEDAAFIAGTETQPWDELASLYVSSGEPQSAWLFDRAGAAERIKLPEGVRDVMPMKGGVVVTTLGLDRTSFYDKQGLRWSLDLAFGNSYPLGHHYLVLGSNAADQVVIEPTSGAVSLFEGGSPYAVGELDGVWISTRTKPASLVGLRLGL